MADKDYTHKNELITEIYHYSKWNIDKLQDFNKKLESRILASLTLTGVGIKLIGDLFNNIEIEQKSIWMILIAIKLFAVGILIWGVYYFLKGIKVGEKPIDSLSIKGIEKNLNLNSYKENKYIFQFNVTKEWCNTEQSLTDVIKEKSNLLNNGIEKIVWSGTIYGIGILIENIVRVYF